MTQKDSFNGMSYKSIFSFSKETDRKWQKCNRKSKIKSKFLSFDSSQKIILDEEMRAQASFASFSSHGEDFTIQYCLKD